MKLLSDETRPIACPGEVFCPAGNDTPAEFTKVAESYNTFYLVITANAKQILNLLEIKYI